MGKERLVHEKALKISLHEKPKTRNQTSDFAQSNIAPKTIHAETRQLEQTFFENLIRESTKYDYVISRHENRTTQSENGHLLKN